MFITTVNTLFNMKDIADIYYRSKKIIKIAVFTLEQN